MKDNMKGRRRDLKAAAKKEKVNRLHDGVQVAEEHKDTPADPNYKFTNS
jgi:DeoR/GlpR family transcriptional regulator of sugar metabolism